MDKNNKKSNKIRPGRKPLRIGLFGGTFNPVHLAHIQISRDIKDGFKLDEIIVMPSAVPPHKISPEIICAEARLEMVKLSFSNEPNFEVSNLELKRVGPSYTIDTVKQLLDDFSSSIELFLIIGSDAFFEIHTWHKFRSLLGLVQLIVMTRPGTNMETDKLKEEHAGSYLSNKISAGYRWSAGKKCFSHETKKTISFFDVTQLSISSTKIRKYIKENSCTSSGFLDNEVANYITKKGLYK